MTRLLERITCSLSNRQSLSDYYRGLNRQQLEEKKKGLWKIYAIPAVAWAISFALIAMEGDMRIPLLILFSGTVAGTIVSLYVDFRKKRQLIEMLLEQDKD